MRVPLKLQPHFVREGVQQQHGLPPGRVDLVPFYGDAGEAAKSEVIDRAKLTAVPAIGGVIKKHPGGNSRRPPGNAPRYPRTTGARGPA